MQKRLSWLMLLKLRRLYGDEIEGYITKGRGIAIHRSDCNNIKSQEGYEQRLIEVEWDERNANKSYLAEIDIYGPVSYTHLDVYKRQLFIFGPEGGISPSEIDAFEEAGGLKIGLGPRIMRTETAPLYALSSVSYALELNK